MILCADSTKEVSHAPSSTLDACHQPLVFSKKNHVKDIVPPGEKNRTHIRINLLVAFRIMFLDMLKLRRLPKSRHGPIQVSKPLV